MMNYFPIREKVELPHQVTAEPRRPTRVRSAPEWYGNPVLEFMLLDHDKPTNYEEAMMSQIPQNSLKP